MLPKPKSIGQYHDAWSWVLGSAPDNFKLHGLQVIDQAAELRNSFQWLEDHFAFAERKVRNPRLARILREMLGISYRAYVVGDKKKGAHVLQECEGMIWSKQSLRIKHAVEAEQRAFGELILFKNIRISPYPYEGSKADLHADQALLFDLAQEHCHKFIDARKDFASLAWAMKSSGEIARLSVQPEGDQKSLLPPLQNSWRGCYNKLRELSADGSIRACVHASAIGIPGRGTVSYVLERRDAPRIEAFEGFDLLPDATRKYAPVRFHLKDPHFFESPFDAAQQQAALDAIASGPSTFDQSGE